MTSISKRDASLRPGKNASDVIVKGTLRNVLNESRRKDGKILNALDLPMLCTEDPVSLALATDRVAFQRTTDSPGFPRNSDQFPFHELQWGLAATANAKHPGHIDSDGTATEAKGKNEDCGKYWIIAIPKEGKNIADINFFGDDYDPWKANREMFNYEGIYVRGAHSMYVKTKHKSPN